MLYLFETSGSQSSLYCPFFRQKFSFRTYHNKIQSCHPSICSVKTSVSVGLIPFIWLLGCLIRSLPRVCHVFVICFSSCDVLVVFGLFSNDILNICWRRLDSAVSCCTLYFKVVQLFKIIKTVNYSLDHECSTNQGFSGFWHYFRRFPTVISFVL